MRKLLEHLGLMIFLICVASGILLYSDRTSRISFTNAENKTSPEKIPKAISLEERFHGPAIIALVNLISTPVLDEAREGFLAGLQSRGLLEKKDYLLKEFNAQGDLGLLPQIFDAALRSKPHLLVSIASPTLVAGANHVREVPYVYCVATDPAELGLFREGVPKNITGVYARSTMKELLELALKSCENLNTVGIIYDPAQPQSVLEVEILRKLGKEHGITILEGTASTVSDLSLTARSLMQRGARAFLFSADNLVSAGFTSILKAARGEEVPIFVSDLGLVALGAAGGIGPDFREWGDQAAAQAVQILHGTLPEEIPMEEVRVKTLLPGESSFGTPRKKPLELRMALYNDTETSELCAQGFQEGLRRGGLVEGRDFNLRILNAQGDMSTLSAMMTSLRSEKPDLLMVISTPTLQAAISQIGEEIPMVFSAVGDPVRAGAGSSSKEHRKNVTGISTRPAFETMVKLLRETLPEVRRVGTLFTPGEINSQLYRNWFEEALHSQGLELVSVPVTSTAEITQAVEALCAEKIDLIAQIPDNTTRPGFPQIVRKARERNLPVYTFDTPQMKYGAILGVARDYFDAGLEASEKVLRVLAGTSPGEIPFSNIQAEKLLLNLELAEKYGLFVSPELRGKAKLVTP